jgi:hypothetical protein
MLQKTNRRTAAEKTVHKIQAEAIAFVVVKTIFLSTGRGLVVAPDKPSSLKSVLHPARFKPASCKAALWSSVDTRALPYFMHKSWP